MGDSRALHDDLQLAASIGAALLEENKALKAENGELQTQVQTQTQQCAEAQAAAAALRKANADLRDRASDLSSRLHEAEALWTRSLEDAAQLERSVEQLRGELRMVEQVKGEALETLERLQASERELASANREIEALRGSRRASGVQATKARALLRDALEKGKALEEENAALRGVQKSLAAAVAQKHAVEADLGQSQALVQTLEEQVRESQQQAERLRESMQLLLLREQDTHSRAPPAAPAEERDAAFVVQAPAPTVQSIFQELAASSGPTPTGEYRHLFCLLVRTIDDRYGVQTRVGQLDALYDAALAQHIPVSRWHEWLREATAGPLPRRSWLLCTQWVHRQREAAAAQARAWSTAVANVVHGETSTLSEASQLFVGAARAASGEALRRARRQALEAARVATRELAGAEGLISDARAMARGVDIGKAAEWGVQQLFIVGLWLPFLLRS